MLRYVFGVLVRGILTVVVLGAVLAAAGWAYTHPCRGPRETVDPAAKAYVETIEGQTVVHLKGSPYEMGFQHGALLRDKVNDGIGVFNTLLATAHQETGIPIPVMNFALDCIYRRCAPHIPERFRREIEGLADGAGVDLQVLRRVHVICVITERNCSSFAVFGRASKDGKLYHGHNFDWVVDAGLQKNAALFLYEPDGRTPFAGYGYAGMIGYVSGMNMEGIAIGMIGAVNRDVSWSGVPLMLLLRRVLEESTSLHDAQTVIANAHRTVGYNYVIADGDARDAHAFETSAHHCAMFHAGDASEAAAEYAITIEDAVFRADEAMDPGVRRNQRCANGYPNLPYGSNSYDHRYKGMAMRIRDGYGAINQPEALEILKAVAMKNTNLHSVLCNATDRELWAARASESQDACTQPYTRFDLKKLFLRPENR